MVLVVEDKANDQCILYVPRCPRCMEFMVPVDHRALMPPGGYGSSVDGQMAFIAQLRFKCKNPQHKDLDSVTAEQLAVINTYPMTKQRTKYLGIKKEKRDHRKFR